MSSPRGGYPPSQGGYAAPSTPEVARNEAADVARTAVQTGGQVADTVGEQASRVASETAHQARNLVEEGKGQLAGQAKEGHRKAVSGLHALADQLHGMAEKSDGQGVVPEVTRQAAERTRTVATWLEGREPGDLVEEVRSFARRKPGVFLAGAALAGVVVGRLTRGVIAAQSDSSSADTRPPAPAPVRPPTPTPTPTPMPPPTAQAMNPAYDLPASDRPVAPGYSMPPVQPQWAPQPGSAGPVTR
jgi:hypothetical protein